MKTRIEFLEDPTTGDQPVLALIRQIGADGQQDADLLQMYKLIIRGLDFLRRHGLQDAFKEYFKTHLEDGRPYTILLVKQLNDHVPLLEFRINWQGTGAFRAVFFEHIEGEDQILYFAQAVVKQKTFDLDFETIVAQAEHAYKGFLTRKE